MKFNFWTGLAFVLLVPAGLFISAQAVTSMQHGSKIGVKLVTLEIHFEGDQRAITQSDVNEVLGAQYRVDEISKRVGNTYWLTLEVPSGSSAADLALKLEHLSGVEKVVIH